MNIANTATNTFKTVANSGFIKNQAHKIGNDIGGYAAKFAVASICAKDAVGCYFYVTQSLKNERIPQKKRKFVASLDLANGILMISTQLALAMTISKKSVQKKLQNKLLNNFIIEKGKTNKYLNNLYDGIKKSQTFKKLNPADFEKAVKGVTKTTKTGLAVVTSLIASTIVAKRMIVPFLSTPLASWFKDKYMEKDEKSGVTPAAQKFFTNNTLINNDIYSNFLSKTTQRERK